MLITPRSWVRPSHGPWTVQFRFFCSSFQGTFEFNFWSERSFAELSWKWVQIALICCAVIFGSFAGAGAHHQGLRRLKPCQFQRTCLLALWMWQTLSKCSCSSYWRAVCCSWTRGRKANGPCLTRFQSAFVGSFIEGGKCLDNFWCEIQAWSETYTKIANGLEADFPAQRYVKFPRVQWGQILAAWLLGWGCW